MNNPKKPSLAQGAIQWLRGHGQIPLAILGVAVGLLFIAGMKNRENSRLDIEASLIQREKPLYGQVIAVDAGHGGMDGGAIGRYTQVNEKVLNLSVAQKLEKLLSNLGAEVIMTREDEDMLCPADVEKGQIKKEDMRLRAQKVLDGKAQLVLSIHMNEYTESSARGPQVFYQKGDTVSRTFALVMQEAMQPLYPENHRQAMEGDFFMLRIGPPSLLIECGFISNREEEALLCTDAYQQQVAATIAEGVQQYLLPPSEVEGQ